MSTEEEKLIHSDSDNSTKRRARRFKLRTILLAVSLAVLILPLGGIYIFRFYEGELVKQTEIELIAQAALIAAIYKREVDALLQHQVGAAEYGGKVALAQVKDEYFRPVKPQLTLANYRIRSRPADAAATQQQADKIAQEIGARLMPVLLEAQRTNLAGVRLVDWQGIVIGGREDLGKSLAHISEVKQALQGRYRSAIRQRTIRRSQPPLASISRGTGVRVFVAYPVLAGDRLYGAVFLSRTPSSILEHLYGQKEKIVLAGVIVLLLVIALVVFTSYAIARPLHGLIDQTRRFAGGDKKALEPLAKPVTEEVALLSQSFSEMARNVEHRSEYIRNFAAHVSHEFKTPLAAIQGAIELLEEHAEEMSADKRRRFLRNIGQDAERLKRLVDRLLEMARADVLEPSEGECDLALQFDVLRDRYRDQGVSIVLAGATNIRARLPREIVETVLTNLIDNSRQNGANNVDVTIHQVEGALSIHIADNGAGISSANAEKIFTPFFTTHREEGGTGLGLGIVRALLKAYGGDIEFSHADKGAAFTVTIPGAVMG
ncbi:MAG TPA: HAMP domain-containing sensor histidine kinase [Candidatus Binatia bacterium]|nr:HAMP domain-containing sensor histidine kinase [Candidatus Binatia bacterium]